MPVFISIAIVFYVFKRMITEDEQSDERTQQVVPIFFLALI